MTSPPRTAPTLMPDMIIEGLQRFDERPCLHLGDTHATYRDVRESTSRFVQALRSKGLGVGSRVAVLSGNCPEVLYNLAATIVGGLCSTALHPLGSLDDHAFVLRDAGIEALVFDPRTSAARAAALAERIPALILLSLGPSPLATDLIALAQNFEPRPLTAPPVGPDDLNTIVYTGGTTGCPKGVRQAYRSAAYMTLVIAALPEVVQVAVIGMPDDRWGEAVKAVVVPRAGVVADASLRAKIKARVKQAKGAVQVPKSVDFIENMPLTPVGKPDKKHIRAAYWGGRDRAVN